MTVPAIVQVARLQDQGPSVTFGAAPTNGNLLVGIQFHWTNIVSPGTGWTQYAIQNGITLEGWAIYYKVAGAGESTTQSPTTATSAGSGRGGLVVWEISGFNAGSITSGIEPAWFDMLFGQHDIASAASFSHTEYTSGADELILGAFLCEAAQVPSSITGATATDTSGTSSSRGLAGFHVNAASSGAHALTVNNSPNVGGCYVIVSIRSTAPPADPNGNVVQAYAVADSQVSNSGSSITLPKSPTNGNLLVAIIGHFANTVTIGPGWTQITNVLGTTFDGYAVHYKVAGASEPRTQTPSDTSTAQGAIAIFEIANFVTGGSGATPNFLDAVFGDHDIASAASYTHAETTAGANEIILGLFDCYARQTPSSISGATYADSDARNDTSFTRGAAAFFQNAPSAGSHSITVNNSPNVGGAYCAVSVKMAVTLPGGASSVTGTGFADGEALGHPTVTAGAVTVAPTGFADGEALGHPTVTPGAAAVSPAGFTDGEALGSAAVSYQVAGLGFADGAALGHPTVTPGAAAVSPAGFADGETFGLPSASDDVVGLGFVDGEAFGSPTLTPGAVTVSPSGFADGEALGHPSVGAAVDPAGFADGETFGSPTVTAGAVTIAPAGFADGQALGLPNIAPRNAVSPAGFVDGAAFGHPSVTPGAPTIHPAGIAGAETLGHPTVTAGAAIISPKGFADGATIGRPSVVPGPVTVAPKGFLDGEAFGLPTVQIVKKAGQGGGSGSGGVAKAQKFGVQIVMSEAGEILALEMQSSVAKTLNSRMALYADEGGLPGRLLGQTEVKSSVVIGANRYAMLAPFAVAAGTILWPALHSDGNFAWFLSAGGSSRFNADAFADGPSDPFGASSVQSGKAPLFVVYLQSLTLNVVPTGIAGAETIGRPSVTPGAVTISPAGFAELDHVGAPSIAPGGATVSPAGFVDGQAAGLPVVAPGAGHVFATGIAGTEAIGRPSVTRGAVTVSVLGFADGEVIGHPTVSGQAVSLAVLGFAEIEAFGLPTVELAGIPTVDPEFALAYRKRPRRDLEYAEAPERDLAYRKAPARELD